MAPNVIRDGYERTVLDVSSAINGADPDAATLLAAFDGIDGAWERAQVGRAQAASSDTVSLADL